MMIDVTVYDDRCYYLSLTHAIRLPLNSNKARKQLQQDRNLGTLAQRRYNEHAPCHACCCNHMSYYVIWVIAQRATCTPHTQRGSPFLLLGRRVRQISSVDEKWHSFTSKPTNPGQVRQWWWINKSCLWLCLGSGSPWVCNIRHEGKEERERGSNTARSEYSVFRVIQVAQHMLWPGDRKTIQ